MKTRHCVGVTRIWAASVVACLALLCVPTAGMAAEPPHSPAKRADAASALLARGSGYGQPQGEPSVRALQRRLRALGHRPGPIDGLYGPQTEAAVERLQRDSGLTVDGIVGRQTRRVLNADSPPLVPGAGYGQPGGSPQVRDVQRRLRSVGKRPGPVDGLYGPRTQAAVERFQSTAGQPATGVLSSATAVALAREAGDQPAERVSNTRSEKKSRRDARRAANRAATSGASDDGRKADQSKTAGGSDRSQSRPASGGDRGEGTDDTDSSSLVVGLVLAAIALLAGWSYVRRRRREPTRVPSGWAKPEPASNNGSTAATPPVAAPRSSEPPALGYVSVRELEAEGGREFRDQLAVIDEACSERGLVLEEVISDLEQIEVQGPERPGLQSALQRLAAGEASCLVVAELGRLSHSAAEVGRIVESLGRQHVRLVAVDDRLDTGTEGGRAAAEKLVALCALNGHRPPAAGDHRGAESARQSSAASNGGSRPANYDVAALKNRIRAMRRSGMTLQAIADRLNNEKVPTLRGGTAWRPSGVQAAAGYRRPPRAAPGPEPVDVNGSNGGSGGTG